MVVADVAVMSVAEVARRHGLSWHKVMELVHGHAVVVGRHRRRRITRVVVIDEKSTHKGHHDFVTIVSDGETGAVIAVLGGRSGPVLERFLAAQGHRWRRGVEVVVTDLATCWKSVIAARLPHAAHVADRFHVVRTFLRVQVEFRRRAQASPLGEPHDPELFRSRFLQTKRADRLCDEERAQLEAILERHPTLRAAWNLVQHFHAVYEAESPEAAMVALDTFADEYAKGLVDFGPAIRTLFDLDVARGADGAGEAAGLVVGRGGGLVPHVGVGDRAAQQVHGGGDGAGGVGDAGPQRAEGHHVAVADRSCRLQPEGRDGHRADPSPSVVGAGPGRLGVAVGADHSPESVVDIRSPTRSPPPLRQGRPRYGA